ncbi:hypothetical protein [Tardiphaga sp. 285_C5_N1_2]|uniref:hypothetical protein n=1 Tax=Tardiphaga sp. 285_C5_N1_2 TaxID=3240775 RepID=UPI003F88B460
MKVTLSKEELEREALAEIRGRAGCETVKAVDVEYCDLRADTNWTMFAFSEGDPDALHRALEATLEKLRHRYELRAPE